MAGNAIGREERMCELVGDYAEKLFYFCLKKTGSAHEAEDLTSDILLNIFAALEKGIVPEHLPAWVWKIARNRYSAWADRKHRKMASVAGGDIGDFEIEDKAANPEEALTQAEQLRLLRREMSFISSDYRDILVAYYMQGRKIGDIARSLGLPDGTVMSKLHRARSILREGMNMAREFGKRSYQPEEIRFVCSGSQPSGLPWSAIRRKIPVNILCEAHNNPSTLQELALELGVAAPYMEEEAALLVKAELLKKLENGKYLTNFFIVPKECQSDVNELVCTFAERNAAAMWLLAGKMREQAMRLGVERGDYSEADGQMFFAFCLEQHITNSAFTGGLFDKFKRADGGSWGIIGFERGSACRLPASFFNNQISFWGGTSWNGYQASAKDDVFGTKRHDRDVPDDYLLPTLRAIAEGADPLVFSGTERENLKILMDMGFCRQRSDGTVFVNALVHKGDMREQLGAYLRSQAEHAALLKDVRELVDAAKAIVARYANPYLQDDFEYYVSMSVFELRSTLAHLWKDRGLYDGDSAQFCALYC